MIATTKRPYRMAPDPVEPGPNVEFRHVPGTKWLWAGDDGQLYTTAHGKLRLKAWKWGRRPYPAVSHGRAGIMAVAVAVARAWLGPKPPGMIVRHVFDRDITDNRPSNLRYGTYQQNYEDRVYHEILDRCANEAHVPYTGTWNHALPA